MAIGAAKRPFGQNGYALSVNYSNYLINEERRILMKKWQKIMYVGSSKSVRRMWVALNKRESSRFVMG